MLRITLPTASHSGLFILEGRLTGLWAQELLRVGRSVEARGVRRTMLLEDLSLPVGTRVFGEIGVPTTVPGVVAPFGDGSHLIRWDDGYSTIPLGKAREYDEYIAAHTELRPTLCLRAEPKAEQHNERAGASARDYTAGVRRA